MRNIYLNGLNNFSILSGITWSIFKCGISFVSSYNNVTCYNNVTPSGFYFCFSYVL